MSLSSSPPPPPLPNMSPPNSPSSDRRSPPLLPSPPPPPLPDISPPHSPTSDRHSPPLLPPPPNQLGQMPVHPSSSGDENSEEYDSDESYYSSDSYTKDENLEVRKPKVSTVRCYEVNASPNLSGNEDNLDDPERIHSAAKLNGKSIYSSRRSSAAREDRSSRPGSAGRDDRSSRLGSAARVKKKKTRSGPRVSKYKENNKTVRQHIKPGTVEDLATLFTERRHTENDEHVGVSSTSPNQSDGFHWSHGNSEIQQQVERKHSGEQVEIDFIAASKVIQEKLILSRNNSLHRPSMAKSENSLDLNENTNGKEEEQNLKNEIFDSTQANEGLDYGESVIKANTKPSKSFEDDKYHEQGTTELERTNMTDDLQTNNERRVHGSKQKMLWRNNQGPLKLIMSKGVSGRIYRKDRDKLDERKDTSDRDINKAVDTPQSTLEPVSIDNITVLETIQASSSYTSTHSSIRNNYSNDLKLSRHSHAINNNDDTLLSNGGQIKVGLDETDFKNDSDYHVDNNVRQSRPEIKSGGFSSVIKDELKTMTSEIDNGVSEGNEVDKNNGSALDSTVSVKDNDQNVSKSQDDSWIAIDVPQHINGFDNDDILTNSTVENVNKVDGIDGISDVNSMLRHEDDKNITSSQTSTVSKTDITSLPEREKGETVTKPLKNTFITAERLTQPEHSANVNMQLLKNLQSQTREGSRPDLFAHSSRVWSGMMRTDDDDGDVGGRREEGRMEAEKRDGVTRGDIQTNKRPVLLHSQTSSERTDHNNLESNEDISTCVNSETGNVGDDFLSILDNVHIENDSTSYFVKNRNKLLNSSKVSDIDSKDKVIANNSSKDYFMSADNKSRETSKSEEQNVIPVHYAESQLSTSFNANSSDSNNNSLVGQSKLNIEQEIQELHRKLSPQSSLKDAIAKDISGFNVADHLSSISSSSFSSADSSQTGNITELKGSKRKSKITRETAFNVDFFTSSTEEKQKEKLEETSGNDVIIEDVLEVDQNSTIGDTPASKNNDKVSLRQLKVGREESDSRNQSSHSDSNEIPAEESQQGGIITSRESFRSVRELFESEQDKSSSQRTSSFKSRRSLNLDRHPSDANKKWRRSGGSWAVDDSVDIFVNDNNSSGVVDSKNRVSEPVLSKEDASSSLSSSSSSKSKATKKQEEESTMTAVVGKVSSFNIHRRGSPRPESQHVSSSQTGSNNSDVYLIQDKSGDVYALQEVNTTQPATHTYEGDNYSSLDTSSSSQHISYHRDRPAELYVDGSGINDSKAREVISAYLSTDQNLNHNNAMSQSHSQTYNARDESFSTSSITNNPHSIVVHQGDDSGGGYVTNGGFNNNNLLNNSTVTVDTQMDGRFDSSQTWSSGHNEPYTVGRGGDSGYKSSLVVTNLNTPSQKMYSTYSNTPSVNTSLDSQFHNGGHVIGGSHSIHSHQPLMVNVNQGQEVITPFRTTPVTVQTTTSAIVGEKVDMKIDFPVIEQPQVTTTAELAHSSSDEDNKKHYVIKSVTPKKSSLKISRDNDSSLDSNSDLIYTKRESLTGDIIIGGNRKTVIDNRNNTDHSSKTYVMSNANQNGRGRSKTKVSGKTNHHSPERFFKNAQLSLRRDKNDSSDEEAKKYRTVTRVVLDSDNVDNSYSRSGSESPQNHYRVVSNQSSRYQDNSLSEDDQYYEVASRHSELDTRGKRRRYKVINNSHGIIDSESVRAHSSPKPPKSHSKSFEENYVTKLEHRTTPSHYRTLPSSSKRHKTVIQLDLGNSGISERGRTVSEFSEPTPRIYRTKSVDSLSKGLKVFQANDSVDNRTMWRTGRARSVCSSSGESSSDFEGSGPYNLTPTLVNTSKQKRGNKTYVVKSTFDDHHSHPPGWYKSTIDINEKHPERYDQNFILQNTNSNSNNQSFSQSERITQQQSDISSSQTTEKSVYYVREAAQPSYTQIPVQASPDSGRGTEFYSSDGENESTKKKFERVERIYEVRTEPELPEQFLDDSVSTDMRVLRGKILIQNRMDESSHFEDEFEENTNLFDNSFHLGKDNPLYASDSDLMAALQREEEQEMSRHVTQDITYDQVDSMSQKYKTSAKAEITSRPKRKQNLSTLLLSKLANVDKKDIRQTINVEHHNEEIVGDINFIHADGKKSGSKNTSNFDSVTENVELTLQQGKAYVIIKVIAERIIPTDLEFNIWRKSQAIVTRQIEIDLLANEQRRRFYHHVMDTQGRPSLEGGSGRSHVSDMGQQEKQLNSMETLKLFSKILDIADGQGDKDHTTMRTKQEMGQLPSGADLLY